VGDFVQKIEGGITMAYFSNGTEGDVLDNQCAQCPLGQLPCPVALVQLEYNYEQLDDGNAKLREAMNLLINEQGICKTFELLKERKLAPIEDSPPEPLTTAQTILPSMVPWAKERKLI
jgi:hypothetical protein